MPLCAAVRIIFSRGEHVEKILNVGLVNKIFAVSLEKFAEVKNVAVNVIESFGKVVGINLHGGQVGVRVRVAKIIFIPIGLSALLHDIIPCVNIIGVEVGKDIKWRAAQLEDFGIFLNDIFNYAVAAFGSGTFVRIVNDDKIPVGIKNFHVLIECAADNFRAAQVLNRNEVEEIFTAGNIVVLAEKSIIGTLKNFVEVFLPTAIYNGSVRENNRLGKFHHVSDFQRAESFAESHFGIPEKFFAGLEIIDGLIDGVDLFGAEVIIRKFFGLGFTPAALNSFNGILDGVEVDFKPFAPPGIFEMVTIFFQDAVNGIISEGLPVISYSKFDVLKVVLNAGSLRVAVNAFSCGQRQIFFGRRKIFNRGVADFE